MLPLNDDLDHRSQMITFIMLSCICMLSFVYFCITSRKDKRSAGMQREAIGWSMSIGWTKLRSRFPSRRLAFI